jgi:hypothetical protein
MFSDPRKARDEKEEADYHCLICRSTFIYGVVFDCRHAMCVLCVDALKDMAAVRSNYDDNMLCPIDRHSISPWVLGTAEWIIKLYRYHMREIGFDELLANYEPLEFFEKLAMRLEDIEPAIIAYPYHYRTLAENVANDIKFAIENNVCPDSMEVARGLMILVGIGYEKNIEAAKAIFYEQRLVAPGKVYLLWCLYHYGFNAVDRNRYLAGGRYTELHYLQTQLSKLKTNHPMVFYLNLRLQTEPAVSRNNFVIRDAYLWMVHEATFTTYDDSGDNVELAAKYRSLTMSQMESILGKRPSDLDLRYAYLKKLYRDDPISAIVGLQNIPQLRVFEWLEEKFQIIENYDGISRVRDWGLAMMTSTDAGIYAYALWQKEKKLDYLEQAAKNGHPQGIYYWAEHLATADAPSRATILELHQSNTVHYKSMIRIIEHITQQLSPEPELEARLALERELDSYIKLSLEATIGKTDDDHAQQEIHLEHLLDRALLVGDASTISNMLYRFHDYVSFGFHQRLAAALVQQSRGESGAKRALEDGDEAHAKKAKA